MLIEPNKDIDDNCNNYKDRNYYEDHNISDNYNKQEMIIEIWWRRDVFTLNIGDYYYNNEDQNDKEINCNGMRKVSVVYKVRVSNEIGEKENGKDSSSSVSSFSHQRFLVIIVRVATIVDDLEDRITR